MVNGNSGLSTGEMADAMGALLQQYAQEFFLLLGLAGLVLAIAGYNGTILAGVSIGVLYSMAKRGR